MAQATLSIVNTDRAVLRASIAVAGRTRWTVFDPTTDRFFVNIADPPSIVVVGGADPTRVSMTIQDRGGGARTALEIDQAGRLYRACDGGRLLVLAPPTYEVAAELRLAARPTLSSSTRSTAT